MSNTLTYAAPTHRVRLGPLAIGAMALAMVGAFDLLLAPWVLLWQDKVISTWPLFWRAVVEGGPTVVTALTLLVAVIFLCQVSIAASSSIRWKAIVCMGAGIACQLLDLIGVSLAMRWEYLLRTGIPFKDIEWMIHTVQVISVTARLLTLLLTLAGIFFLLHVGSRLPSRPIASVGALGLGLSLLLELWKFASGAIYTSAEFLHFDLTRYADALQTADRCAWIGGGAVNLICWGTIAVLAITLARRSHQNRSRVPG